MVNNHKPSFITAMSGASTIDALTPPSTTDEV